MIKITGFLTSITLVCFCCGSSRYSQVFNYKNHFYKYYNDGKGSSFSNARQRCLDDGGYLLVLNSVEESRKLSLFHLSIDYLHEDDIIGFAYIGLFWDKICVDQSCPWELSWITEGAFGLVWNGWVDLVHFNTSHVGELPPKTNVVMHNFAPSTFFLLPESFEFPFICEFHNVCLSAISPCGSGGVCETSDSITFKCTCDEYHEGSRCESTINFCESSPCVHGKCMDLESGGFECDCTGSGYQGKLIHCTCMRTSFRCNV